MNMVWKLKPAAYTDCKLLVKILQGQEDPSLTLRKGALADDPAVFIIYFCE